MLGEIKIMSEVDSEQLGIAHAINVCDAKLLGKCGISSPETLDLRKTSSTVLSWFKDILFSCRPGFWFTAK